MAILQIKQWEIFIWVKFKFFEHSSSMQHLPWKYDQPEGLRGGCVLLKELSNFTEVFSSSPSLRLPCSGIKTQQGKWHESNNNVPDHWEIILHGKWLFLYLKSWVFTLQTFGKEIPRIYLNLFKRLSKRAADQNVRASRLPNSNWALMSLWTIWMTFRSLFNFLPICPLLFRSTIKASFHKLCKIVRTNFSSREMHGFFLLERNWEL